MKSATLIGQFTFVILGVMLLVSPPAKGAELNLNVLTYNMRYENIVKPPETHPWEKRKPGIIHSLQEYDGDIVGTQELRKWQLDDLIGDLGEAWASVGEAMFLTEDEHSAILYRADRFEYLEGDTIWLSETPQKRGSKSWGSAHPRILTYGRFRSIASGVEFYFFNTHLDHVSAEARREALKIIVEQMLEVEEYPTILTGDFNMSLDSPDMELMLHYSKKFPDNFSPFAADFGEHSATYHGYTGMTEGAPIDYIFYSAKHWELKSTKIIRDKWQDEYFYSDHYPVYSRLRLK